MIQDIDIERTRQAIDNVHERWHQQRPAAVTDLLPLMAAARELVELVTTSCHAPQPHVCAQPPGHDGPHRCEACGKEWST